jgi:hypothetical protein
MHRLNIFDQLGNVRADLDEKEIAKLSDEQKPALFAVLSAFADTNAADAACIEVEKAVRKGETALGKARQAYEAALPKWTFHDEWKVTVAKLPRPEPDPAVMKRVKAALKAVTAAEEHLEACRVALIPAKALRQEKRKAFTVALNIWATMDGQPKNVGDLIKERSRVERKIAMDNIGAGLPPGYAVDQASTVGDSHLDRFKAGGGRGHSADHGYHQNKMRGATLRPKLPSEL